MDRRVVAWHVGWTELRADGGLGLGLLGHDTDRGWLIMLLRERLLNGCRHAGRWGRDGLRGLWRRLRRGLLWGAGECYGQSFCDVRLAGPPEDLVVAQVAVVRDDLHVALGGLDEFDQVAVVIGETHLCGPPHTPPCGVVRAHKSADFARWRRVSGCEDGRRKSAKIWPKGSEN